MRRNIKKIIIALLVFVFLVCSTGCTQADHVSVNVSKEADNFNVVRRLTVINCRSDKVILQMIGRISIQDVTNGIAVIVEIDRERQIYQKHYVYLNDWTMYTVEDVSGVSVSPYDYELEFMPKSIVDVKITANEIKQDNGENVINPIEDEEKDEEDE